MNEAQLYSNQIGFSYPSLHAISATTDTHPIPVNNIEFNINELENFKSCIDGKQGGILKNDIITAVLFKMFASSWNQFDYSQVRFNDSTSYALRTISIASKGTNFISFDINNDNNKIIST
ncbi:hypothetical protein DICPUDRAFT_75769 [Dictyostelium purpureum]|uniref:Uncharacterized protein n=1 Tax=Dictyostelium purpureum TaxID=5786 RepID=F0ZBM4_DICPU|nr:uncharacterized protein DICPUDRAFT_75769 [Dictyostelium purpureum]EGC38621.1 hypothetical protein DICPUDRAFT_75769 [Dictyostelium purpureum]|eukprot:XP_003284814.1 hypothetical protein DICPUDRAFT_75769 [Dictyostelium purpureum]